MISETDANGTARAFIRDALGRLEAEVDTSAGGATETACYTWDTQKQGHLTSATSPDGVENDFVYDVAARISQTTMLTKGERLTVDRTYDPSGRLFTLTYPTIGGTRFALHYQYAPDGTVSSVNDFSTGVDGVAYWRALDRATDGQLTSELFGNGVETDLTYNNDNGTLHTIDTSCSGTCVDPGLDFLSLTLNYDQNLNLHSIDDAISGEHQTFEYDAVQRLTKWKSDKGSGFEASYGYDDIGNLVHRDTPSTTGLASVDFTIDPVHAHQATSSTLGTYAYDLAGNQTSSPERSRVAYAPFRLPRGIHRADGGQTKLGYDAMQNRAWKEVSGEGRTIYVDGIFERRELGAGDTLNVHHIVVPGRVVAEVIWEQKKGGLAKSTIYRHADENGSALVATDDKGHEIRAQRQRFDPFGLRIDPDDPTKTISAPVQVLRGFVDLEHDDADGLINMNGRLYDPAMGRFISPDPIVAFPTLAQSLNRYAYALNNPLNVIDPTGFQPEGNVPPDSPGWHANPVYVNGDLPAGPPAPEPDPSGGYNGTWTPDQKPAAGGAPGAAPNPTGASDDQGGDHSQDGDETPNDDEGFSEQVTGTVAAGPTFDAFWFLVGIGGGYAETRVPGGVALDLYAFKPGSPAMTAGKGLGEVIGGVQDLIASIRLGAGGAAVTSKGGVTVGPIAIAVSIESAANAVLSIGVGVANLRGGLMDGAYQKSASGGGGKPDKWKVGDPITKPTSSGKTPSWSAQRARYWKNAAAEVDAVDKWGPENVERMKEGLAPQRYNFDKGGMESMELSHEPVPQRDGGTEVVARWPQEHAAVDPFRRPGY